jgi:amino acid transporter
MLSLKNTLTASTLAPALWFVAATRAFAANFGPGLNNLGGTDIRPTIENVITTILSYLALAAVIVIVIAGIRLIVSSGDDSAVEKAKKTILYAIIGLIIILLANGIVMLVANIATA